MTFTSITSNHYFEVRLFLAEDGRFFVPIGRVDSPEDGRSIVAWLEREFPGYGCGFRIVETGVYRPASQFQWPDDLGLTGVTV